MTPLQAYNHTVSTLVRYRDSLGVNEVNMNATKWNIWGAIYYSMTIYTTIVNFYFIIQKKKLQNIFLGLW